MAPTEEAWDALEQSSNVERRISRRSQSHLLENGDNSFYDDNHQSQWFSRKWRQWHTCIVVWKMVTMPIGIGIYIIYIIDYNDNHVFLCPVSSFPTLGQSRWFCGKCSRHIFLHDDDHNFHDVQHTYHNHYNHYPQIWVHCSIGGLVLVIAFILTAGYAITCRNMWDIIAIIISLHFDHQNADGRNVFFYM